MQLENADTTRAPTPRELNNIENAQYNFDRNLSIFVQSQNVIYVLKTIIIL